MPKENIVEFPNLEKELDPSCPFMSQPVQVGFTNGGSALAPVPVPNYQLMRVPCIKGMCKLWIPGKNAGAFSGTVAPTDVSGCCSLEGKGLA